MVSQRARQLRGNSTDAERALWRLLRDRRLDGFKFRRQVAFGPFVADFVCFECRIIIEVDGGQHAADNAIIRDAHRTNWFEDQGFHVARFWNTEVLSNPDGVLQVVLGLLRRS